MSQNCLCCYSCILPDQNYIENKQQQNILMIAVFLTLNLSKQNGFCLQRMPQIYQHLTLL